MIKYTSSKQMTIYDFISPFGNNLNPDNRWVNLASIIPWDDLAEIYHTKLCSNFGAPAKDSRIILGSIIIKHKMNLSDEETMEQIRENFYLQYFLGLKEYTDSYVFHPSLFVTIRKRMGIDEFNAFSAKIIETCDKATVKKSKPNKDDHDDFCSGNTDGKGKSNNLEKPDNCDANIPCKGKLVIDATVANQAIKYPNDLDLLNEGREFTETFIDYCHKYFILTCKPRTYRKNARKDYLSVIKLKKKSKQILRKALFKQLNYLKRNLKNLKGLLLALTAEERCSIPAKLWRKFWIIQEIYRQQKEMFDAKSHSCKDRIVSTSQPQVRPIMRGKNNAQTEFGAKIGISLTDGFATIDNHSWNSYHEGIDLMTAVENYKKIKGYYPEVVIADPAYGSRDNRKKLKLLNIRFGGKPLGRPKQETQYNKAELKAEKKQRRLDYLLRIPVEGKIGQAKGRYRLNYIRAKLANTAASWVGCIFFVVNLVKLAKNIANFIVLFFLVWFFSSFKKIVEQKSFLINFQCA